MEMAPYPRHCETCAARIKPPRVFCDACEPPLTLHEELTLLTPEEWLARNPHLPRERWLNLFKETT